VDAIRTFQNLQKLSEKYNSQYCQELWQINDGIPWRSCSQFRRIQIFQKKVRRGRKGKGKRKGKRKGKGKRKLKLKSKLIFWLNHILNKKSFLSNELLSNR